MLSAWVLSLVFGVLHLHLGLTASMLACIGSMLLGVLYTRHKTLIGVTIVHYWLGLTAALLGYI